MYSVCVLMQCSYTKMLVHDVVSDTILPHALIQKLRHTGLNTHTLHWVCSCLTNREQLVLVNGATSESLPVISGFPQGSVLGPLLFLIYIDGVTSTPLSDGSKMTLHVC